MKGKISMVIFCAVLILCAFIMSFTTASADSGVLVGDADGSGTVNINDVLTLLKQVTLEDTDVGNLSGDMDGSGTIDINDVLMLLKRVTAIDTPTPEAPTYRVLISSDPHCTDLLDWYGVSNEARMELWLESILAEHERQPFDLIIINGDISLDTHNGETCYTKGYSTSKIFIDDYVSRLPANVPVYILAGNHETMPENDWVALTGNSRQCTHVVGNNTFIMLDTFANITGQNALDPPYTPADVAYIKEQMDAYPENNVYLVAHHFPLDEEMINESSAFREILRDERVIGLFGGHTHLNTPVQYNSNCGNKVQVQTGNFSYTNGSFDTSFWGFRDLVITEDSATTSYIQAECDAVINGRWRHYDRKVTEVVDFMNPTYFTEYTGENGTIYKKLYDYINYSSISGVTGLLNFPAKNMFDDMNYTEWFPQFNSNNQAVISWSMTEAVTLDGYVMVTGYQDLRCIPTSWTLYAGNSASSLSVIDVRTNADMPDTIRTNSDVFTIASPAAYKYYKLVFTNNNSNGGNRGYDITEMILLTKK